jgi:hypothetical protein
MAAVKKKPANPVTARDLKRFDAFARKWQEKLNLRDYRVQRDPKRSRHMAECKPNVTARIVSLYVGTDFGDHKVTARRLERIAFHEMGHAFLAEFKAFCREDTCEEDIDAAEHRIIHTLEDLFFGPFEGEV